MRLASRFATSGHGRWIRKGTLAITDQGLISGSNFVLSVLLARWLEPAEYGVYALGFAAYLFVLAFFQALMLEPFIVLGASEYHNRFASYLAGMLRLQGLLSLMQVCLFGLGAIVCALISPWRPGVGMLLGLAVGSPLLLVFWLLRTASYITSDSSIATKAAGVYCVVLLAAISVAGKLGHLSSQVAFLIMGLAAAVASISVIRQLKPAWRSVDQGSGSLSVMSLAREHWNFGRWELSKCGLDWICENMSYAVSGSILGVAQAGALKALITLFLPLNQTMTALRRIVLPYLSRTYKNEGRQRTAAAIWFVSLLYGSGALLYCLAMAIAARWIVPALYRGKFPEIAGLIPWFTLFVLGSVPVLVMDMGLRAVRLPKAIFVSSTLAAFPTLVLAWPVTMMFGMRGLILNGLLPLAIFFVSMGRTLRSALEVKPSAAPLPIFRADCDREVESV